jgi:hypothetical protein
MSGIFSAACNRGLIATNPLRETRIDTKMKPPKPAESYSLREVEDMISLPCRRLTHTVAMPSSRAGATSW